MSRAEGRTMAVAGIVLLLASTLRWGWEARRPPLSLPGDTVVVSTLLEASREELEEEQLRRRPLAKGEALDPNRAPAAQLDRLPGVGPSVAAAIVEEREESGFFANPGDLERVRGIGPATRKKIATYLDFSRPPPARSVLRRNRGPLEAVPVSPGQQASPPIDVNVADELGLQELTGVGPALARRIVEFRSAHGPFRRPEDLLGVRGIGPRTLERLQGQVRFGR